MNLQNNLPSSWAYLFNVVGYFSVLKWKISVSIINMICLKQNVINLQRTNIFWDHLKKEMRDNEKREQFRRKQDG